MISIAILGFGAMGQMHAQCLQFVRDAQLAGIIAVNRDRALSSLQKMGLQSPVYESLESLLSDQAIDAVSLCLPTHLHLEYGLQVIAAGNHLFCEKPLARNLADATALADAAQKAGITLMVGQCIRFWPEYQVLEDYVRTCKAGKLRSLSMHRRCSTPVYSNSGWLQDEEKSGGAAFDLHIHDTDYILHLLGTPSAVSSVGTRDQLGWSHIYTQYAYPDIAVTSEGGWNYPQSYGFTMGYEAVFEHGVLQYDYRSSPTLHFFGADVSEAVEVPRREFKSSGTVTGNIPDLDAYVSELEYFSRCLCHGEPPTIATASQAIETLRILTTEIQSLENSRSAGS